MRSQKGDAWSALVAQSADAVLRFDSELDSIIANGTRCFSDLARTELASLLGDELSAMRLEAYCSKGPHRPVLLPPDKGPSMHKASAMAMARIRKAAEKLEAELLANQMKWRQLFGITVLLNPKALHSTDPLLLPTEWPNILVELAQLKACAEEGEAKAKAMNRPGKRPALGEVHYLVGSLVPMLRLRWGVPDAYGSRSKMVRIVELVASELNVDGDVRAVIRREHQRRRAMRLGIRGRAD